MLKPRIFLKHNYEDSWILNFADSNVSSLNYQGSYDDSTYHLSTCTQNFPWIQCNVTE